MEILCIILALVALLVAAYSLLELWHDKKSRQDVSDELDVALKEQANAMAALAETHNALVKAQETIDQRLENAELQMSALRNQMPVQRRI